MEFCINLFDGRIAAFNEEVARQTAYAQVPEDVALAVANGKLDWHRVVELIHKKRNNDPNFSWNAFDKLRDQQNIRRAKYEPDEMEKAEEKVEDTVSQISISMDELVAAEKQTAKTAPVGRGRPVKDAKDNVSSLDTAFSLSK